MRFRNLWVAYLLLCGQVAWADQRILIIGDSISEHIYCWPNEMRLIDPQMNLQLHTQGGRSIRDYSPPRDLRNVSGKDIVIYFLGTNDAIGGYEMLYVNDGFTGHMAFLQERGFRVIVLLPPPATKLEPQINKVRQVLIMQSERMGIEYHDLAFWDETMTKDGLHPGPELSRLVADFVYSLLEPVLQTGSIKYLPECTPDSETALSGSDHQD
ncbi:MAG: hypothetical protein GWP63_01700 [Haliea sp.]|jgi:hypothetical protein|nr:hypothetical protein [Haliea sp.]